MHHPHNNYFVKTLRSCIIVVVESGLVIQFDPREIDTVEWVGGLGELKLVESEDRVFCGRRCSHNHIATLMSGLK